jgi:hypothetical protein
MEDHMKKGLLIFLLLSFSLLIGPANPASAWTYNIGDDGWWNGTHYNLDKLEFFILSPGTFANPSQTDFSVPGWQAAWVNPTYSVATGPGAGAVFWTFHFADPYSGPITLDWLAYSGGNFLGDARVTFTGGSFSYNNLINPDPSSYDRSAVPLPPTVLLLGTGLLGLLGLRRKATGLNRNEMKFE